MDLNPAGSLIDGAFINKILKPRDLFSHKGDYGHAGIIAGSIGMMGAAVLAVKACLRSGAGKVTAYTGSIGYNIMQICVPEAMTKIAGENFIFSVEDIQRFDSIGLGPGLGFYETHTDLLKNIFSTFQKPMVIDADALNILSKNFFLVDRLI
jgi:NAD(P)H-hydrate epimerase